MSSEISQKRGPWSSSEDAYLMTLVNIHGAANWVQISHALMSRTPKQCRERYHQNLKPSLNHAPITPAEGAQIERLVSIHGRRWADIARRMNGRSDNAVKNWWNGNQNRRKRSDRRHRVESHEQQQQYDRPELSISTHASHQSTLPSPPQAAQQHQHQPLYPYPYPPPYGEQPRASPAISEPRATFVHQSPPRAAPYHQQHQQHQHHPHHSHHRYSPLLGDQPLASPAISEPRASFASHSFPRIAQHQHQHQHHHHHHPYPPPSNEQPLASPSFSEPRGLFALHSSPRAAPHKKYPLPLGERPMVSPTISESTESEFGSNYAISSGPSQPHSYLEYRLPPLRAPWSYETAASKLPSLKHLADAALAQQSPESGESQPSQLPRPRHQSQAESHKHQEG